jgi:hypothetical protein
MLSEAYKTVVYLLKNEWLTTNPHIFSYYIVVREILSLVIGHTHKTLEHGTVVCAHIIRAMSYSRL